MNEPARALVPSGRQRLDRAVVPGVSIRVILSEEADAFGGDAKLGDRAFDDLSGLLGVAGAVVEDVAIWRGLSQEPGPGERAPEGDLLLLRDGDRDRCGGSPHVPKDREDAVLVDQPPHVRGGTGGLVPVVERDQRDLTPMHAPSLIVLIQRRLNPHAHPMAQRARWACERRRHPEFEGVGLAHS